MRFAHRLCTGALALICAGGHVRPVERASLQAGESRAAPVPATLSALARRADHRRGWLPLARYAASVRNPELKGLAYFALGYRQFEAGDYPAALEHLGRAASAGLALADFASYYRAQTADKAGKPGVAVQSLIDFKARFPHSTLLPDATRVLTRSQIAAGAFQQALLVLAASAEFRDQPWYLFLLGEAQQKLGNRAAAATTFNRLCYRFPDSTDAALAAKALGGLQSSLGASFPGPSIELREARARALESDGRFREAMDGYEALLSGQPQSASAPDWRHGRDRCLYRQDRAADALADLSSGGWPQGEIDARRGLLAVHCQERLANAGGLESELDRLGRLYPASPIYASALHSASYFFRARGDVARSSQYSELLATGFPHSDLGENAQWQVAWTAYLAGDSSAARQKMLAYVLAHPASRRAAAALYWLGRLSEAGAQPSVARAFYALLRNQFRNNYYSLEAGKRLTKLEGVTNGAARDAVPGNDGLAVRGADAPWETQFSEVAAAVSAPGPHRDPEFLCPERRPSAEERPALVLAALGLDDLAARDLRARIAAAGSGSAEAEELRLALARLQRDREKFDQAAYYAREVVPDYADFEFSSLPSDFWSLLYPKAFWGLLRRDAALNHLDPYLVMAVIREESGFNPHATSGARAHGLMQLLAPTAREVARETARRRRRVNLDDPGTNLRIGCHYLSGMVREFDGNLEEALAAYNAGPIRVRQWLAVRSFPEPAAFVESIPFVDTQTYVEAVIRDATVYRRLMTGPVKFKICPSASRPGVAPARRGRRRTKPQESRKPK